jgi:hypothetical protein
LHRAQEFFAEIDRSLRDQSPTAELSRPNPDWQPGRLHPNLSWTHYRTLVKVESLDARAFYEIETLKTKWSSREMERQINSLLFERLAKSTDKQGLMQLAMMRW